MEKEKVDVIELDKSVDQFTILLNKVRFYRLVFFQGTKSDEKIFIFKGGLKDAELRGRKHCDVMGYRFGIVRPAIVDLEHQEKLKHSDIEWDERYENPEDTLRRKELAMKR